MRFVDLSCHKAGRSEEPDAVSGSVLFRKPGVLHLGDSVLDVTFELAHDL
jgi:hypothetical protein